MTGPPKGRVHIIAHRGASAYAPENSLAAFALAADMNADYFELDCTLSRDGEVVVIHDDTLERTGGVDERVHDLSFEEMRRFDVGSWFDPKFAHERVPSLSEALDLAKGCIGVYIEIKNSDDDHDLVHELLALPAEGERLLPEHRDAAMALIDASGSRNLELTRRVIADVRERGMQDHVVIQSFSGVVCLVALAEAADIRTELLANSNRDAPAFLEHSLQWRDVLGAAGFNLSREAVTKELVEKCHAKELTVAAFTVNDEADMRRLIGLGVDALITNHPDVALRVAESSAKP